MKSKQTIQQSMTGFGDSYTEIEGGIVQIEVKTLNSKFLDINFKYPKNIFPYENTMREIIKSKLKRGKINVSIEAELKSKIPQQSINATLYNEKHKEIASLEKTLTNKDVAKIVLSMSGVVNNTVNTLEFKWASIEEGFVLAIEKCVLFRKTEGQAIVVSIKESIHNIHQTLMQIPDLEKSRNQSFQDRIHGKIELLKNQITFDTNRLEQEFFYHLDRLDTIEEQERLKQHIHYFLEILDKEALSGKKIIFLLQEMAREVNTLGSKANDASIQHLVVHMKDELEIMKEQAMNIL